MSRRRPAGRRVAARPHRGGHGEARAAGRGSDRPARSAGRDGGRGAGRTAGRGLGAVGGIAALLTVVATVAALLAAGQPVRTGDATTPDLRQTAVERTFVCTGGLPGARVRVGGVAGSALDGVRIDDQPATPGDRRLSDPLRVEVSPDRVASTYALRWARGRGWLAAGECPSPRQQWWFVGVSGSTSHGSVVRVDNPRAGDAVVDVDVFGPEGRVDAPGLRGLRVASHGSMDLDLRTLAASFGDLAVRVVASRGLVTAAAPEAWSSALANRQVRDWVTPQPRATRRTTLVGLSRPTRNADLLVANPGDTEAVVRLRYVGENGTFTPTEDADTRVAPHSVRVLALPGLAKAAPYAVRVRSQVPVATSVRSRSGLDEAHAVAGPPLSGSAVAGVPPGVRARLHLVAGGAAAKVEVTGFDAAGEQVHTADVEVPAGAAHSLPLERGVAAVRVRVSAGSARAVILARGPGGGIATVPVSSSEGFGTVPVVRPGW